ncbi:nuclear division protein [Spathaspora passalidarum NRRL Y-27907]|uniref:Nuclear division protein n=1 Tax=Spathaspora passalidarum (strain NRRL Y-27907 / 11-Y1) TaxID=619300 RepID=G3AV23_SPAPN|nr:nuclear division protein [Spathaspora passalidarum NRRL Y-27907]EGW30097.1 nuclear division protein [Spathaspora passalidarum NRRL Y-27907]
MSKSHRAGSPIPNERPTAKRSPSILVTDVRSHNIKGTRAPFAGQNFRKQQEQLQQQQSSQGYTFQQSAHQTALQKRLAFRNKYTDISVDKLLSNSSDIPSGQSRLPSNRYDSPPLQPTNALEIPRRNIRSIPKLSQSLPSRTSKTSQKLVLIPEQQQQQQQQQQQHHLHHHNNHNHPHRPGSISPPLQPTVSTSSSPPLPPTSPELQPQITRSRAELMDKDARAQEFSRMTAYFICESFNLKAVAKFLRENHEVKPRVYDEALYVPYSLPLLPGNDGLRVKSNNSAKLMANNRYMEKLINRSEQTDHLYEYYSGVETPEDANNYSMDPEVEDTNAPFDPSEPQFFAPPLEERPMTEDAIINESVSSPPPAELPPNRVKKFLSTSAEQQRSASPLHSQSIVSKHHAEMFIFEYGIVVFWNFSEIHEKNILADLAFSEEQLVINPIDEQDIETEEFHFEYDPQIHRPRIYNDMVTLRSGDHMIKLTMSHAIAQSTKLGLFESKLVNILSSISRIPKKLALTGRIGYKRNQLLKKSGKLFKLRVDVNLSSSILDTPDFFWSIEPALHPLYQAVREYLEIDQRVTVLNDRCKMFLEFVDIASDSMSEKNTNRITWMIIVIIGLSLFVSLFEFILEILPHK